MDTQLLNSEATTLKDVAAALAKECQTGGAAWLGEVLNAKQQELQLPDGNTVTIRPVHDFHLCDSNLYRVFQLSTAWTKYWGLINTQPATPPMLHNLRVSSVSLSVTPSIEYLPVRGLSINIQLKNDLQRAVELFHSTHKIGLGKILDECGEVDLIFPCGTPVKGRHVRTTIEAGIPSFAIFTLPGYSERLYRIYISDAPPVTGRIHITEMQGNVLPILSLSPVGPLIKIETP